MELETRAMKESHGLINHGSFLMSVTTNNQFLNYKEDFIMAFFNSAVGVLQTLVIALGAGLGICAVFVYGVGTFLPDALQVMKYIGAAYILWLAIHIAISKPEVSEEQGSASFMKGFLLQFVNIKIYMFGITALTGFITPYSKALWTLIGFELLIATIGTIATSTWIGAGLLIQKFYLKHYRIINIILALTLLECIWSMLRT
jgi:cysteine/O-acetylserine efflux protein